MPISSTLEMGFFMNRILIVDVEGIKMAKFLNSSGTTYHLEELIKNASDRLIIISPYLKLNERIKELL